jgi:hypothetical protein
MRSKIFSKKTQLSTSLKAYFYLYCVDEKFTRRIDSILDNDEE